MSSLPIVPTIMFSMALIFIGGLFLYIQHFSTSELPNARSMSFRERIMYPVYDSSAPRWSAWTTLGIGLIALGLLIMPIMLLDGRCQLKKDLAYSHVNWLQEVSQNPARLAEVKPKDVTLEMCKVAAEKDPDSVLTQIKTSNTHEGITTTSPLCLTYLQQFECGDLIRIVRDAKHDVPVPEEKYRLCLTEQIIAAVREGGLHADDAKKLAMVLDK